MSTSLDTYIAELLFDYDCVIVPQLGGFVTNYRPAKIDEKSGTAHPAGKDVRFNRNLTKNDGLLAQAFAHSKGWTFEEANEHIKASVEDYLQKLNEGAKVKFKKIGVLYIDEHRNFRFEPSNEQNFLKSAIGFESFSLPSFVEVELPQLNQVLPVQKAPEEKPQIKETPVVAIEPAMGESNHTRSIYWVAAATLIPFIGLSVYVGMATGFKSPTDITVADLNPFGDKHVAEPRYTPRAMHAESKTWTNWTSAYDSSVRRVELTDIIEIASAEPDTTSMRNPTDGTVKSRSETAASGIYHIIGGCFREEENAHKFIRQAAEKGVGASILDQHKSLYRVKLESFERYDDALKELDATRSNGTFPNAWLLKKPAS